MAAQSIHLVRVTCDDQRHHLWAAATSREEAVDRVLDAIPEGWAARLLDEPCSDSAGLDMTAGEVRDISRIQDAALLRSGTSSPSAVARSIR
jgi:hypothetical protein